LQINEVTETQSVGAQFPMTVTLKVASTTPKFIPLKVTEDGPHTGLLLGHLRAPGDAEFELRRAKRCGKPKKKGALHRHP
jgi:hypothetical protein